MGDPAAERRFRFFLFLWSADRGARPNSTVSVVVPCQRINMAAAEVGALPTRGTDLFFRIDISHPPHYHSPRSPSFTTS